MRFANRVEAGRALAGQLQALAGRDDVVVLGLPRGGVPVAAEVARTLAAPLDVLLVRKLGAPGQPELAIGAIAEEGIRLVNEDVLLSLGLSLDTIDRVVADERPELERRLRAYRGDRAAVPVAAREACDRLRAVAHEVVAVWTPSPFWAVGAWYADFAQTTDEQVVEALAAAAQPAR